MDTLSPFFAPQGVVVIGASQDPTKLGYGLARNLVQCNYRGAVHFVNPHGGRLLNRTIYTRLAEVPDPVDLAVILIPAPYVPQALLDCAGRGIQAAIVASGGFRESSAEGAALEETILQIARGHNLRFIGPNCIGLMDTHLPLDTTFLQPPGPPPGDIAFVSHSGAICAAVIDWARGQGFGLSRLVSLGNQADLTEADVLVPVAEDPFTRVLTLYLEGVGDGRRFVREAQRVTQNKPIVALKVGRFASGQRAAASHTGALAGQEIAYTAAFQRAGVIRAETSEELFDWARALAWCPLPAGRAVAVLTNAGGPGVTAADALEANHLRLAELAASTRSALQSSLPSAASLHNPVDMLASATPEQYAECLKILLADPGVDAALVILPPPPMHTAGAVAKSLIPVIHNATKPVTIALMGERLIQEAVEHFRAAHIPEYRFPERAASALAILVERADYLNRRMNFTAQPYPVDPQAVQAVLSGKSSLDAGDCMDILQAYGIPGMPLRLARSAEQAVQIADQLGYPLVLKIASPDLTHKSDVGGVLLNLGDAAALAHGFTSLVQSVKAACPEIEIHGAHLQRMLPAGQEVILGAVQDEQFGPLVMFGSGGIEVEGLKDVAFSLAPIAREEALDMLEATWAGRRLHGFRSLPPADRAAVVEILQRLAQLAADFPRLKEIEINPLRVLPDQQGAFAVDVRMSLAD